ncbi:hypothetical protein KK062_30465, partial [Fulvivirgaceae bacterium PWU5]
NSDCINPSTYITDFNALTVAQFNGTQWVDMGRGGVSGVVTNGSITSSLSIPQGYITLGSYSAANTLPVELLEFSAISGANVINIKWT